MQLYGTNAEEYTHFVGGRKQSSAEKENNVKK
jgi:hypothetical protein